MTLEDLQHSEPEKDPHVCRRCRSAFDNRPGAKCPECGTWNTIVPLRDAMDLPMPARALQGLGPIQLQPTGFVPWDKTMGGIFVGGVYLLGASPGAGKSSSCLQILGSWQETDRLYISAEEQREAVAARSIRFGCPDVPIIAMATLAGICELISLALPGTLVVVDSLQKIDVPGERMGGVSALKQSVEEIKKARARSGATIILISHVTKDDDYAGPKTVEHDVDACAMMTQIGQARVLRCDTKNRFAPTGKTSWMRMTSAGLVDSSPDLILPPETLPGRVLTITSEGMPSEVQAMASSRSGGLVIGLPEERARLACTLISQDKGDFMIRADGDALERDASSDLAVILAVASEVLGKPLPQRCCAWGQVTLDGRILPGSNHDDRAQVARDLELLPTFSAESVKTVEDALDALGMLEGIEQIKDQQEEALAERGE
jgi:DNA repair protein RadA/Sms